MTQGEDINITIYSKGDPSTALRFAQDDNTEVVNLKNHLSVIFLFYEINSPKNSITSSFDLAPTKSFTILPSLKTLNDGIDIIPCS